MLLTALGHAGIVVKHDLHFPAEKVLNEKGGYRALAEGGVLLGPLRPVPRRAGLDRPGGKQAII